MRRRAVILLLAALALVVAGCGGSSKKKPTTAAVAATTAAAPSGASGGTSAGAGGTILQGVQATPSGPVKSDVTVVLKIAGTPKDATVAAFLSEPITMHFAGATDAAAKKNDLTFTVKLGAANIEGHVLSDGAKSWIQLAGQWYELPASGTGSSTSIDPSAALKAFGSPSAYFTSVNVVGDEDVGGIGSTHVTGAVNVAKLVQSLQKVAGSASSSLGGALGGSGSTTPAQLGKLGDALKGAKVDLWIGKSDQQIHRAAFAVKAGLPASTSGSSAGITGVEIKLDATALPTGSVSVSPPSGAKPAAELQQALGQLLLPILSGSGGAGGAFSLPSTTG